MSKILEMIDLYTAGNSIPMVSKALGIPLSTIRFRLHRLSLLRTHREAAELAVKSGRFAGRPARSGFTLSDDARRRISEARKRHADANAAGVSLKPSGYLEVTRGEDKGKHYHRVVVERAIGRKLESCEVIHHIDGDKTNNNLDNLQVMTAQEHSSLHARENLNRRTRDEFGRFI